MRHVALLCLICTLTSWHPARAEVEVMPRLTTFAEAAHTVALSDDIRGVVATGIDAQVLRGPRWSLEIFTTFRSYVRYNREGEGVVRISPRQIHFPVGARVRFPIDAETLAASKYSWGLQAFHQSNHDIDENDPVLNRETISYEVYGVTWWSPHLKALAGVYYDRGTTRAGKHQTLPFDYYLAGAQLDGWYPLSARIYGRMAFEGIVHTNGERAPGHLNVNITTDLGLRWPGASGEIRTFLRGQRLEDYRFLGDTSQHMLMVGLTLQGLDLGTPQ
ncbi:MAG: hypothetical protein ACE366_22350 [Bradymonadia bacterium]